MESTISALTQNANQSSLDVFFSNPIVSIILTSGLIAAILGFIFKFIFKLGSKDTQFDTALLDISGLKTDVKKLLSYMTIIRTHLVNKGGLDGSLFGPGSPLKLFSKGIALVNSTGFEKIYINNKKKFIDEFKKYELKTLSDIDEASYKVMEKYSEDNKLMNYKQIAFQNGITLDLLLKVYAIYLRDKVAEDILKNTETISK